MSGWDVSTEQWRRWLDEVPLHQGPPPACDELDGEVVRRLQAMPFLGAESTFVGAVGDETAVRPDPQDASFDSMTTMIRTGPPAQDDVANEVGPRAEAHGLHVGVSSAGMEVELEPAYPGESSASDGGPEREEPASTEDVEGLYIPTLTRAVTERVATAEAPGPQSDAANAPPYGAFAPPGASAARPAASNPVSQPASEPGTPLFADPSSRPTPVEPIQTGETVVADVPAEPKTTRGGTVETPAANDTPGVPQEQPAASSSQTAGEIVSADQDPAAESLTDGEIEEISGPSKPKIVIGSPSKVEIYEDDTDELDASDLVEEPEEITPPPPPEAEDAVTGEAPPQPPQPPPKPSAERAEGETHAALAQLHAEVGGGSAADFEQRAKEAEQREARAWYEDVFGEHYASLGRKNAGRVAKGEVDFWLTSSGLEPGARILDVGCGEGAHALAMAQRGYAVTGLDASPHQLRRAAKANEALSAGVKFVQGDMREPPVEGPFEGILCIGTTLGYFDDEDNRKVLKQLASLLAPKGRMLLQVFNRDYVVARLPARSWWQGHGCLVLDEAEMNFFKNRLKVHRTVVFETGQQFEHDIHLRAYTAYELGRLCVASGLRIVEISGSRFTRSRFYGATSPEIWLLVERS